MVLINISAGSHVLHKSNVIQFQLTAAWFATILPTPLPEDQFHFSVFQAFLC